MHDGGRWVTQARRALGLQLPIIRCSMPKKVDAVTWVSTRSTCSPSPRHESGRSRPAGLLQGVDSIEHRDATTAAELVEAAQSPARSLTFRQAVRDYIDAKHAGGKNAKHVAQWGVDPRGVRISEDGRSPLLRHRCPCRPECSLADLVDQDENRFPRARSHRKRSRLRQDPRRTTGREPGPLEEEPCPGAC